ncbi:efflux RND transporter periplasmic adaptor subunit [Flavobacteriaceae bacterium]|nr:efflux RND transporter periplasmic adaptor subunit [Flavobacteriaceae bacterium]
MSIILLRRTLSVLLVALLLASCGQSGNQAPETAKPRLVRTLTVGGPSAGAWQEYPAKVEAAQVAVLAFRVSGELAQLIAREGDKVNSDQLVAKLDDKDQQIRLRARKAEYERAQADFERGQSVFKSGGISRSDVQRLETTASTARSNNESAERDVQATELRAPFSGFIAVRSVENFEEVSALEPIYTLQDVSTIFVKVEVPESIMIRARREQEVQVSAFFDTIPDRRFPLELNEVATRASDGSNTFQVTFEFPNTQDFTILPGMSVTVRMENPATMVTSEVLFVPAQAVLADEAGAFAFVALPGVDNLAVIEARRLTVGDLTGAGLEVRSGLAPGDQLVTAGMSKLQNGQSVRLSRNIPQ